MPYDALTKDVPFWIPPLAAFAISFLTSMGGVSGAFLLLPFQVSVLGHAAPSVSATNQLYNVVAIPSGVYRYVKERRMVWPLAWAVLLGSLPGVFVGAIVRVAYLPDPRHFKLFAAAVLLYIGSRMTNDLVKGKATTREMPMGERDGRAGDLRRNARAEEEGWPAVRVTESSASRIRYEFRGAEHGISTPALWGTSFTVGVVGGIYGIGGGAIIAPILVSVFGLPVHTVAGATLLGTFATSVAGVAWYRAIAFFTPGASVAPDWMLGISLGLGGLPGMYLGARCQKYVSAQAILWMLSGVVILAALKYVWDFFGR